MFELRGLDHIRSYEKVEDSMTFSLHLCIFGIRITFIKKLMLHSLLSLFFLCG